MPIDTPLIHSIDEWRVNTKTAATFTYQQLQEWIKEFLIDSCGKGSPDELLLTSFLCWLRQNKGV